MELLLDAVLIAREPERLDAYYAALAQVDAVEVERMVIQLAPRQPQNLARFINIFRDVQFLRGYVDPPQLRERLNQVLQRVRLPPLPVEAVTVLENGYELVTGAGRLASPARSVSLVWHHIFRFQDAIGLPANVSGPALAATIGFDSLPCGGERYYEVRYESVAVGLTQ